MISNEMKNQLMTLGLTKQQSESVTADVIINRLMNDDGKMLIQEAKNQVEELSKQHSELMQKMSTISRMLFDILEIQKEFGNVSDDKAKTTIALYATLIEVGKRAGATGIDAVTNAGYVTYAYLGGQARRNTEYNKTENNNFQSEYPGY
ncbi:MAG: hypothetical protein IJ859_04725 [Synergistaceae bacterium]|nr:hypothetical protein [Synergistaceae bacterium]